ncbi:hypothetical protein BT69DRAFT_1072890 [Atractiella rhizophila]|nr:hypothetical protein BT69DRAFT_1072890 [Atractiella rhizophila]
MRTPQTRRTSSSLDIFLLTLEFPPETYPIQQILFIRSFGHKYPAQTIDFSFFDNTASYLAYSRSLSTQPRHPHTNYYSLSSSNPKLHYYRQRRFPNIPCWQAEVQSAARSTQAPIQSLVTRTFVDLNTRPPNRLISPLHPSSRDEVIRSHVT